MVAKRRVPERTIPRTLLYIRILDDLLKRGEDHVSSGELARMTGFQDNQIRKDISNFGPVGKPRVGYPVRALKKRLEASVHGAPVQVVLFGTGNLGKAIARYPEFHSSKINIAAGFDKDPRKIGKQIDGIKIYALSQAKRVVKQKKAVIGINAVPKEAAQDVVDIMVAAGIRGIINFSPVTVTVPDKVTVKNIDLTIEFMALLCDMRMVKAG